MKKYFLIILFILSSGQLLLAQSGYVINLSLDHLAGHSVELSYTVGDQKVIDSARANQSGMITFKGKLTEPVVAFLRVKNPNLSFAAAPGYKRIITSPPVEIILNNARIDIKGDADSIVLADVTGGLNGEWGDLRLKFSRFAQEQLSASRYTATAYLSTKATEVLLHPGNVAIRNYGLSDSLKNDYIKAHPSNFLSVYFLKDIVSKFDDAGLNKAYSGLKNNYKRTQYGKFIEERIRINALNRLNKPATDFIKSDTLGRPVSLSKLKGKYVLLDFWGSWCGPCVKSFPNLIAQYNRYHHKGFEIIGIASEATYDLNKAKQSWKAGIRDNKLPWLQVLDNENTAQVDLAKLYAVSGYPTQILINREGKVIARYVGERTELNTILEKLFKE
ncbi:TlpA family protein disulfide reductase [Pedobacter metabolipauper]|uniref:Thiol-disulfide isomerase/thioredoxin n=1 Tax=Pedobacter metabolipauper TaxID=425513 RepID=A0A4V3D0P0_9SPHI|nr:TlpA disulfide reductase family protein [Pedobacter metabolipauper]TDQ06646.1 thiol-disulfide isomerase/thioredoxin [Pedobacter metabolipauper]